MMRLNCIATREPRRSTDGATRSRRLRNPEIVDIDRSSAGSRLSTSGQLTREPAPRALCVGFRRGRKNPTTVAKIFEERQAVLSIMIDPQTSEWILDLEFPDGGPRPKIIDTLKLGRTLRPPARSAPTNSVARHATIPVPCYVGHSLR
jgi:hypothetical protein